MGVSNLMMPVFEESDVTFKATAPVVGKRYVAPSGNRTGGIGLSDDLENVYRMAHCPVGKVPAGLSRHDVATGDEGGCLGQPGRIGLVTAVADVTAGDALEVGADGRCRPQNTGKYAGLAMSGGLAGQDIEVKLP